MGATDLCLHKNWVVSQRYSCSVCWSDCYESCWGQLHYCMSIVKAYVTDSFPYPMDLIHSLTSCFIKIHFSIIFPPLPRSNSDLSPFSFLTSYVYISISSMCATCCAHFIFILIIYGREYKLWSSWICSFLQLPLPSLLLGSNILLNTLFSNPSNLILRWLTKFQIHIKQQV